ncbi:hypothetical protein Glove_326g95 [Diversispora epigaea]|uniref:Uncharacterized protein n=1 Tax=Diversispora epigaea TaxID=1348612 RepID=A0A397HRK1_9GLOM|nr:hypothetical protein Glove_326g95 [Diversispora epigaea]
MFINYLLERKCQVICCGDNAQPPPFFEEIPHEWLKKHANYYEEKYLEKEWTPSDRILSAHRLSQRIASQKCLELHRTKYPDTPIPLIYRPRDGCKQNCLIPIPGLSEKQELVKNDIIYLSLNMLPETFIADILKEEKNIDWDLAWDNLIYLTIDRIEYLNQLIQIKGPSLPLEIVEARNKKAIKQFLRVFISEKFVGYINQDKKKGCKFNLSVDYVLKLKDSQKDKCELYLIEMK